MEKMDSMESRSPRPSQCLGLPWSDSSTGLSGLRHNSASLGVDESLLSRSRRSSARFMSQSVREALKTLRQREHRNRVAFLLEQKMLYYKRQRYGECIVVLTVLLLVLALTLYVLVAFGLRISVERRFELVRPKGKTWEKAVQHEGGWVDLMCESDSAWEWCRWIHLERYCDFEWLSSSLGIVQLDCDFQTNKIAFIGNYKDNECGLRVHNLNIADRGLWQCELEQFHLGFARRHGEVRMGSFHMVVLESTESSVTTTSDFNVTSHDINKKAKNVSVTPPKTTVTRKLSETTTQSSMEMTEEENKEYERNFFLLKILIIGGIGVVLLVLAILFWCYFMYLWRVWDAHKRDRVHSKDIIIDNDQRSFHSAFALSNESEQSIGSPFDQDELRMALLNSKRKSVSFTVCRLQDPDSMSFDLITRSVPLPSSRSGSVHTIGSAERSLTPSNESIKINLNTKRRAASRRLSLAPEHALDIRMESPRPKPRRGRRASARSALGRRDNTRDDNKDNEHNKEAIADNPDKEG